MYILKSSIAILFFCLSLEVYADSFIIVNHKSPINTVSRNTARAIFSMRVRAWQDGSRITVFVLPHRSKHHRHFVRTVLSMIPHQLRRSWDRYVYAGLGQAPIEVKDEKEMLTMIMTTAGSIGYIREDIEHESVRKVPIN